MSSYKITATYDDNGCRCLCDRSYAMGDYAHQEWSDKEEAEAVADELREGVGTVVDASVEYVVDEA